jgi:hypothetical protein
MLKSKQNRVDVDFDFNILTAFIRLGRAGPDRGRVPSILLFDFDFDFIVFYYIFMYWEKDYEHGTAGQAPRAFFQYNRPVLAVGSLHAAPG